MNGATFTRTGRTVAFLDVHIGAPFFAHGSYWVRTSFDGATKLAGTVDGHQSACNFLIDGTIEPARGPYSHKGEVCEPVEIVEFAVTS